MFLVKHIKSFKLRNTAIPKYIYMYILKFRFLKICERSIRSKFVNKNLIKLSHLIWTLYKNTYIFSVKEIVVECISQLRNSNLVKSFMRHFSSLAIYNYFYIRGHNSRTFDFPSSWERGWVSILLVLVCQKCVCECIYNAITTDLLLYGFHSLSFLVRFHSHLGEYVMRIFYIHMKTKFSDPHTRTSDTNTHKHTAKHTSI